MGVCMKAYKIEKRINEKDIEEVDFTIYLYNLNSFKDRLKHPEGYYTIADGEYPDTDTIPYGSFNNLRREIAKMCGFDLDEFWEYPDKNKPFYFLLWFADNEGAIDEDHCKIIYQDFKKYQDLAKYRLTEYHYMFYKQLMKVFKSGSRENCVVIYH